MYFTLATIKILNTHAKYFKYKYKYFWEKVFKIQVQNTTHIFKIVF